jgi:hypothetical protein
VSKLTYNDDEDRWEGLPDRTTVQDDWTLLVLDNGMRILSFGGRRQAGDDVHVLDAEGKSITSWSCGEWEVEGEGEVVMGAILRCAAGLRAMA